jgi:cell division protein FtsZ
MVDEKLEDQVWVTVVATGYGDQRPRRRDERAVLRSIEEPVGGLREPEGEPRVSRVRPRETSSPLELDVPEFIPRR